jgi:hypothetical protein
MSLQKKILFRYRQQFPNDTLKEVSARTGIQMTRVFRLFNGKPMKVGELEALERALNVKLAENPQARRLHSLLEEISVTLGENEIKKIMIYAERKLLNRGLAHYVEGQNIESAVIA